MSIACASDGLLKHRPVLPCAADTYLVRNPDGIYVDATFGRGGHTKLILGKLSPKGRLFAFDRDKEALDVAGEIRDSRFTIIGAPFSRLAEELALRGITRVDGVLMDIGVSSPQIDDPQRGFSFRFDGPLDMRMDQTQGMTAADWLREKSESEIETVIREYGEERYAKAIARAITREEKENPILTTSHLAALLERTVPRSSHDQTQHPATRTFQALRIAVNDELGELKKALTAAGSILDAGGRLAVISFHSLEDRIVKRFFSEGAKPAAAIDPRLILRASEMPPALWCECERILPDEKEIEENPRSRSAVLRLATRTEAPWKDYGRCL